jgi:hypothetical protein
MRRPLQADMCLRQQGTSPRFVVRFRALRAKTNNDRKKKYRAAAGDNASATRPRNLCHMKDTSKTAWKLGIKEKDHPSDRDAVEYVVDCHPPTETIA